ncbi:MAG: class I SAM-dependent methyltransferase [Saprospirales bacterium]|nr:class I SAM-dependent methyltransferase [Saprospirales bacterium]
MADLKTLINDIRDAEENGPLFENEILTGYSGKKLFGTLQRLGRHLVTPDQCYLEVGVYQGLTLLSVAKALEVGTAYGIDNFAFFDPDHKNLTIVNNRMEKLGISNAGLINQDYEDALENLDTHLNGKKVGLYFVDGPHDYRSQLMCLLLIQPYLADNCVIVVDDCDYQHVRQANRDFLQTYPEFKLLFESYSPAHPYNLKGETLEEARNGWWNGVNIMVRDTKNELERSFPPTERSRALFENDHLVHAAQFPTEAPEALRLLRSLKTFQLHKTLIFLIKALFSRPGVRGRFRSMNTFSEKLPKSRYAMVK